MIHPPAAGPGRPAGEPQRRATMRVAAMAFAVVVAIGMVTAVALGRPGSGDPTAEPPAGEPGLLAARATEQMPPVAPPTGSDGMTPESAETSGISEIPAPPGSAGPSGAPGSGDPSAQEPGSGEAPGSAEPSGEAPGSADPSGEAPGSDDPSGKAPGSDDPSRKAPGSGDPSRKAPGSDDPSRKAPGSGDPSRKAPESSRPPGEAEVFTFQALADLKGRASPDLEATVVKKIAYPIGSAVPVVCQVTGGEAFGSKIWDLTADGYYVTDSYVDTGHLEFVPDIPTCSSR